jgi:hypothetical protein
MRPKIYVAYAYGQRRNLSLEEREENALASGRIARDLILKGWNPFVPNLFHWVHEGWPETPDEEIWGKMVKEWLPVCDAFFMGAWTEGCFMELTEALILRKTIYYSLEEVPDRG